MDPINIDPATAAALRRIFAAQQKQAEKYKALYGAYKQLSAEHEDVKLSLGRIEASVKKASERIRYIEDIPGKRVPYALTFSIEIPGPATPTTSIAGQRLSVTRQLSMDGPFVCTQYLGAMLMKTFSLGPYSDPSPGRPTDPPAGQEVITPLTGRWRPVASSADPFAGAYIGPFVGPQTVAGAQVPQTFRPGIADFLFEIQDEGSDRLRQNQTPIPSRYLFSEFDRPFYLPVGDFFERGTPVTFAATMTRDLGFAEINAATFPQGFNETSFPDPQPNPQTVPTAGRVVVGLGGTLYFTMWGYKILQAQSPAV